MGDPKNQSFTEFMQQSKTAAPSFTEFMQPENKTVTFAGPGGVTQTGTIESDPSLLKSIWSWIKNGLAASGQAQAEPGNVENLKAVMKATEPSKAENRTVMNNAPIIGGGLGGVLGGVPGAIIGGTAGQTAKQMYRASTGLPLRVGLFDRNQAEGKPLEMAADTLLAGVGQGLLEKGGRALSRPIEGVMTGLFNPLKSKGLTPEAIQLSRNIEDLSQRHGLMLTAPEINAGTRSGSLGGSLQRVGQSGVFGNPIASHYQDVGERNAKTLMANMLSALAPDLESRPGGQAINSAVEQASDIFHREGGQVIESILNDAAKNNVKVDVRQLQQTVVNEIRKNLQAHSPDNPLLKMDKETADIFRGILKLPEDTPFITIKAILNKLGEIGDSKNPLMSPKTQGTAKFLYGKTLDAIDSTLKTGSRANPMTANIAQRFNNWRQFYAEGGELFGESSLASLARTARTEPEKLVEKIGYGDVSKAQALQDAILGYSKFATPAERQANLDAWNVLQRRFAQQKLLMGSDGTVDLYGLKTRLNGFGDETLRRIYNTPKGQAFLSNARLLAEAMDRVQKNRGVSLVGMSRLINGIAASVGLADYGYHRNSTEAIGAALGVEAVPALITAALYSPTATRYLVNGIGQQAAGAVGPATANILRAFQVALQSESTPEKGKAQATNQ